MQSKNLRRLSQYMEMTYDAQSEQTRTLGLESANQTSNRLWGELLPDVYKSILRGVDLNKGLRLRVHTQHGHFDILTTRLTASATPCNPENVSAYTLTDNGMLCEAPMDCWPFPFAADKSPAMVLGQRKALIGGTLCAYLPSRAHLFWLLHDVYHVFDDRLTWPYRGEPPYAKIRFVRPGFSPEDAFWEIEQETLRWGTDLMPELAASRSVDRALEEVEKDLKTGTMYPVASRYKPAIALEWGLGWESLPLTLESDAA